MIQTSLSLIGQIVRRARRTKRLSQDQLAQLSGVSRSRIAALEGDQISDITFGNLMNILHALDLDLRVAALNRQRPTLEDLRSDDGDAS